jgi:MFS family permease
LEQKQAKRFTFSILLLIFIYAFVMNTPSLFMNDVIKDFQLKSFEQGSISSMIGIGSLLSLFAMLTMQGRIKKWTMILLSAAAQAVLMALMGFITEYWLLLMTYVLLGVGMGWLDSASNSSIVDINKGSSAKYMGALHGSFGLGAFVSPFILQAFMGVMIWRHVYFVIAGFMALGIIYFLVQTRRDGGHITVSSIDESKLHWREVTGYLKNRYNLLLIGGGTLYSATLVCLSLWIVHYMTESFTRTKILWFEMEPAEMGAAALSIFWLFSTISRFFTPRIKMRPLKLFVIGIASVSVLHALGVLSNDPVVLIIMFGAIGLMSGQCMPNLMNEVNSKYPGRTSLPTSVMMFMMCIARILMPLLVGYVMAVSTGMIGMLLPVVTSLLSALSSFVALRVDRKTEAVSDTISA